MRLSKAGNARFGVKKESVVCGPVVCWRVHIWFADSLITQLREAHPCSLSSFLSDFINSTTPAPPAFPLPERAPPCVVRTSSHRTHCSAPPHLSSPHTVQYPRPGSHECALLEAERDGASGEADAQHDVDADDVMKRECARSLLLLPPRDGAVVDGPELTLVFGQ